MYEWMEEPGCKSGWRSPDVRVDGGAWMYEWMEEHVPSPISSDNRRG